MEKPATSDDSAKLMERLQSFIGKGGEKTRVARDKITVEGVRAITDISGDRNPIYSDEAFAKQSVHGGLVAPPMSVLSWSVDNFCPVNTSDWVDADGVRHYKLEGNPAREETGPGADRRFGVLSDVLAVLAEAGYTSPAVTNGDYVFTRYPKVGDRLRFGEPKIESIKGPKVTSLGEGYFISQAQQVLDEDGEEVCVMRHSSISFRPPS